ncbi:MAG: hypothetical protein V3V08_13640 [Nannocystaceae bacterium]
MSLLPDVAQIVCSTLWLALAPRTEVPDPDASARQASTTAPPPIHELEPPREPIPRPGIVFARAGMLSNFVRSGVGYRHALAPRIEVEAAVEYVFPHLGHRHLRAITQSLGVVVWVLPTRSGAFLNPTINSGQHFLSIAPSMRVVAIGGGASAGWGRSFADRIWVAAQAGTSRFRTSSHDRNICTDTKFCVFTQDRWLAHVNLSFGVAL